LSRFKHSSKAFLAVSLTIKDMSLDVYAHTNLDVLKQALEIVES